MSKAYVLLDLFCGRWGWSQAFVEHRWSAVGVDLTEPPWICGWDSHPGRCEFVRQDVLALSVDDIVSWKIDFVVASPPCEQFSVHGMPHFHPNPPYPESGIKLFNHTRALCEASGLPYVIENVRAAQRFVGKATCNAGPFYLWHNFGNFPLKFGVPFKLPQNIKKGFQTGGSIIKKLKCINRQALTDSKSEKRKEWTAKVATIPPELANCVADYAERILEQRPAAPRSRETP